MSDFSGQNVLATFLWFHLEMELASSSDISTRGVALFTDLGVLEYRYVFEYFSCPLVEFLRTTKEIHS